MLSFTSKVSIRINSSIININVTEISNILRSKIYIAVKNEPKKKQFSASLPS